MAAAERHLESALAIALESGRRPLVARCHLGLAELYRRAGRREPAREHLTIARTMLGEIDMRFSLQQEDADAGRLA